MRSRKARTRSPNRLKELTFIEMQFAAMNTMSLHPMSSKTAAARIEAPPFREDAAGAVRVGDSRVLLELVIRAFQDGATLETIVQRYSTMALAALSRSPLSR